MRVRPSKRHYGIRAAGSPEAQGYILGLIQNAGMLGVTLFGLLFTPVFYVICRRLALVGRQPQSREAPRDAETPSPMLPPSGGELHP